MSRFLPDSPQDYSVPGKARNDFTDAEPTVLRDIGRKMKVNLARSKGRVPSPFSQAYLFYLNLFDTGLGDADDATSDAGRKHLRERARQTFRGLCATFALREALGLEIKMREMQLEEDGATVEKQLYPAVRSAPRADKHWNPLRFYTIRQDPDSSSEVLAGQSPLTGLYPAANAPDELNALYWYDASSGRWFDPTSDRLSTGEGSLPVSEETQTVVRQLLKGWLAEAIDLVDGPGALSNYGFTKNDENILQNELKRWRDGIDVTATKRNLIKDRPIKNQDGSNSATLPFLDPACPVPDRHLVSDVPTHDGRLLVRKQDLTDPQTRLFGRKMGARDHHDAVDQLQRKGENLGRALGLDADALPSPYLLVNKLFVSKLTPLTDDGFSEEWDGLVIDGEHYLLPFRPEILDLMSPEELVKSTSAELSSFDDHYRVYLDFGDGEPIEQRYVEKGDDEAGKYVVDAETIPPEAFDLRLFPNFQLDAVSDKLVDDDQKYYARVRWAPTWDFQVGPFYYDEQTGVTKTGGNQIRVGNFEEMVEGDKLSRGEALFLTCNAQPDGFYVEGHGLCRLQLPVPSDPPDDWDVGVDFGTSNTCVSRRVKNPGGNESLEPLELPTFTTTLLSNPKYRTQFENPNGAPVDERSSALLDFFYRRKESEDTTLNQKAYFPTQFITRHRQAKSSPKWDFENGLIFFRNIGLGDHADMRDLMAGYPTSDESAHPKPDFKAKSDLKWDNREWMKAFMLHLRRQVALTAARNNARIETLKFSYPEAFTEDDRNRFRTTLKQTWGDLIGDDEEIRLSSEAVAARDKFVKESGEVAVLDVGGGTTDVIAFRDEHPILQTSYRMAAGLINEYVVASPAFRKAFLDILKSDERVQEENLLSGELEDQFTGVKQGNEDVIETLWIGLLNKLEQADADPQDIFFVLRDSKFDEETDRAVRGFFLSVVILFTGIAFDTGKLLQAASEGRLKDRDPFDPEYVEIRLTGNGSKLLRALHTTESSFNPVLESAFYRGARATGEQEPSFRLSDVSFEGINYGTADESPKVSVSLGLLDEHIFSGGPDNGDETSFEVPIANIVSERPFSSTSSNEEDGMDLVRFYEEAHSSGFDIPRTAPELLDQYFRDLNELLPRGRTRDEGAQILPGIGNDWHELIRDSIYPDSRREIRKRVKQNANDVADTLQKFGPEDVPALESPFIVELRSLIKQIQSDYA